MKKNLIGISLSGGGLSCIAYAGFLERLKEHDISPAYFGGLSGGSLLAILLACDLNSETIKEIFTKLNTISILNIHPHKLEILDHKKLTATIREILPYKNFEDLPRPAIIFTTDVHNKNPMIIKKGDIASSIVASCSVFPILQPVKRMGHLIADGGFSIYYGAKYLRELGAEKVIGVDVTGFTEGGMRGLLNGLYKQINSLEASNTRYELQVDPVDLDVRINFPSPSPFNLLDKFDHLISVGKKSADQNLESIFKLVAG